MSIHITTLQNVFRRSTLRDMYVTGFIDDGSSIPARFRSRCPSLQFHPIWDDVYLQFDETLLRFKSIDQYSKMRISIAERVECDFPIDPDDKFGISSILRAVLQSGGELARVHRMDVYADQDCNPQNGIVAALGLMLDREQYLFFDPLDYNGIHVGSARAREMWLDYHGARYSVTSYITLESDEPLSDALGTVSRKDQSLALPFPADKKQDS